jgi:homocitrate synthase
MVVTSPDYVLGKYNLRMIKDVEDLVGECVGVNTPFNNIATGITAFTVRSPRRLNTALTGNSTRLASMPRPS